MAIFYTGLNLLSNKDQSELKQLATDYAVKINFDKPNCTIKVVVKAYEKDGNRKKFSINVTVSGSGHMLDGSFESWNLRNAVHHAFKKIENQLD